MARIAVPFTLLEADYFLLESILNDTSKNKDVIRRGKILYLSHKGDETHSIALQLDVSVVTVFAVRKRYREHGLNNTLFVAPTFKKIPLETQTYIITLLGKPAPKGCRRWSAALVVKELENLNIYVTVEAVRLVFKKLNVNPKFPLITLSTESMNRSSRD